MSKAPAFRARITAWLRQFPADLLGGLRAGFREIATMLGWYL